MNESIPDIIRRSLLAEEKSLKPVTSVFKKFLKSKVIPYLNKETGEEWKIYEFSGKSSGGMVSYRAITVGSPQLEVSWNFEVARHSPEDEFNLSIFSTRGGVLTGRYDYGRIEVRIKQKDLKTVTKIVPKNIIDALKDPTSWIMP